MALPIEGYEFELTEELAPFMFFVFILLSVSTFGSGLIGHQIRQSLPRALEEPQKRDYVRYAQDANSRLSLLLTIFTASPYAVWRVMQNDLDVEIALFLVVLFMTMLAVVIYWLVMTPPPRMKEPAVIWGRSIGLPREWLVLACAVLINVLLFFVSGIERITEVP